MNQRRLGWVVFLVLLSGVALSLVRGEWPLVLLGLVVGVAWIVVSELQDRRATRQR